MSKLEVEVNDSCENCDHETSNSFQSLVVMEFSTNYDHDAIQWILDKINLPESRGGCGLLTSNILDENHKVIKTHISATTDKLMQTAERMELKKMSHDEDVGMCEFTSARLKQQIFEGSDNLETFFTTAEKQRIILYELESIRAHRRRENIPNTNIFFFPAEAVLPRCQREGIVTDFYALHNREEINKLSEIWVKAIFKRQPLNEIRNYFGETVAIYFAFLGFYTQFLIPPAIFGLISHFFMSLMNEDTAVAVFCVFNLVWATVFLESWKRRASELAYRWGTIRLEHFEEPRATFYGKEIREDPVTGRLQPYYPNRRRLMKFYFVSLPVMAVALAIAFWVMIFYFWMDRIFLEYTSTTSWPALIDTLIMLLPTIVYTLAIIVLSAVYRSIATKLNDWENHRLQSAYDNHLVGKLLVFNFANYFMSLFYVAFYLQNFVLLRQHLATLLITMQLVQQVQESLLPYMIYKWRKVKIVKKILIDDYENKTDNISKTTLLYAERDAARQPYDSTLEDYLELCFQFGYVFFFSAVFPAAAFWALLNNLIEIRTDAFKICRTFRRPFAKLAADIGVWEVAFEIMSVVAVITNCALLALSPRIKEYWLEYGSMNVTLFFFAAEHVILFMKLAIAYLIPDNPKWVEIKLAAAEYRAKHLTIQEHFKGE